MQRYFAFGSNLDPDQMLRRCTRVRELGPARLPGYQLVFAGASARWDNGGVATIVPDPERAVLGLLYALDDDAFARLDRFEGGYDRTRLELDGEDVWTYVRRSATPRNPPSPRYFGIMAHGYGRLGFGLDELLFSLTA